ncbi:Tail length tape measure protein [Sphingobacterium faecium PCAi_F2.5]|nr:Tail length tape measure protein [Sphingobacterium faecium PCAi_F2.5]
MSDEQIGIDFKFNSPEAKRELSDIEKGAKAVNDEVKTGNKPLQDREGILERLKRRMNELREAQNSAMSVDGIAKINKELERYEKELTLVSNAGRVGFDASGQSMISNVGILQRLQQQAGLWQRGMNEATNPAALEKYSQKLALVNAEMSRLTKGQGMGGAGQWNGLQSSINQISRELPAFTYSIQTGFMAISNNLPIFADEINRARAANAALVASGQKAIPVWKQLGTALFSWQTAMSVGITLMTVYGKEIGEWAKDLFGAKKSLGELVTSIQSVNESLKANEFQGAVKDIKTLEIAVKMAKDGFISKKSVVEEYNKTIGRTTGEVKTLQEVETFLVDNASNYIKMTLYKAAAQLQLAEAAKEAAKIQENSSKKAEEFATKADGFSAILKTGGFGKFITKLKGEETQYYDDLIQDAGEARRNAEQKEHEKREKQFTDNAQSLLNKAQEYASSMKIDVVGDDPKKPKSTTAQENLYKQILNGRKDVLDKIRDLDNEYRVISFSEDDKELEALKQKFADFRKILEEENEKISEYNKKNKANVGLINIAAVDPIEKRATNDTKYRQETKKLSDSLSEQKTLYTEYEQYKNQTSEQQAAKRFSKDLDKAKGYYKGLTDQINSLQGKSDNGVITGAEEERLKMLLEILKDFNKTKLAEDDKLFLESFNATKTYNEKLLDIDKKYKKLFAAQEGELTEEQKELLKQARQDDIDALNENEARKNQVLLKAAKQQLTITTAGIKAQIQVIKSLLSRDDLTPEFRIQLDQALVDAKKVSGLGARAATIANLQIQYKKLSDELVRLKKIDSTPQEIKAVNDKLRETQEEIDALNYERFVEMRELLNAVADDVGRLGDMFSNLGDAFGNGLLSFSGGLLSKLATSVDELSVAFDKNATPSQKYIASIGAAVDLLSMVGNAAAERRRAEEEYYRSVIDMQREYNLSLNDQLRLQSQIGESMYVKNYVGRMKDGMVAAEDAIKNYKKAIAELSEKGKISKGLGNAVDWKNVGSGVVSGATLGGVIGSVVPVIGNVLGAVVGGIIGGIVGLFGGKKKKPKYEDLYQSLPKELADKLASSEPQDLTDVKALLQSLNNDKLVDANTKQMIDGVLQWIEKIEEARAQIKEVVQELSGSLGTDMRNNLVEYFKQGESAAKAMGKTVNKVLEDMMSQLLFSKAFDEIFKSFEDKLTDTLLFGDEEDVIDVFADFLKDAGSAGENFYKWMDAAKQAAEKEGLKIFQPEDNSDAIAGRINRTVSEDTASGILGFERARFDLAKLNNQMVQKALDFNMKSYDALLDSLLVQKGIERNTADTVTVLKDEAIPLLKEIKNNTGIKVTR